MTQGIDNIAREGLLKARESHWFRAAARQLLDAEDAVAQLDSVVRHDGSQEQRDTLRVLSAAAAAAPHRSARLAALQEGLALFAAGGASAAGAHTALAGAILSRLQDQGDDAAAIKKALSAETRSITRARKAASKPPQPLRVSQAPHLLESLPADVVRDRKGDVTLLDSQSAVSLLREEGAAASPVETPGQATPSAWARALRWLGIRAAGAVSGPAAAVASHFATLPLLKMPQTPTEFALAEAFLADAGARIQDSQSIGTGVNASSRVALNNQAQALWKPTGGEDRTRLRDQLEPGRQGRREAAAYVVDRWMGHYGHVPPTVFRNVGGRSGAMMWWLNGARPADESPDAEAISSHPRSKAYRRIAILDNVLGNTDRHSGNWMVADGRGAIPIDHGLCFPLRNKDQGGVNYDFDRQVKLDDEATAALRGLIKNRAKITEELEQLLDRRAVDALFERVSTMLRLGHTYDSWRE